jgi:hypothetical protein
MSRWMGYFWRAVAALGEADRTRAYSWAAPNDRIRRERQFDVDLSDQASVDAAFYSLVERRGLVRRDAERHREGQVEQQLQR